ncbi:MAG: hypothetical protein DLM52_01335 [Chthoniobacterales bacterium]|nr:MAG: hypothetical protein DLM52_01335 [Chthoniobacterales bacterium]
MEPQNRIRVVTTRNSTPLRASVVLVTLFAWFAISNHCVLGMLESAKAAVTHAACHESERTPSKSPCQDEQSPCCKNLRATLVDLSIPLVSFDASAFALQPYLVGLIRFPEQRDLLRPLELDRGPPFSVSFAESVLQRSILAHAPPFVA